MEEENNPLASPDPTRSPSAGSAEHDSSPGGPGQAPLPSKGDFPRAGTPEWARMNRRRAELIRKHIRGELSATEHAEYERLQRLSLAALEASLPGYDADAARGVPSRHGA